MGGNESAEYFRQSRSIVEHWGAAIATRFGTVPDANHFTAIAPLADPGSPMVRRLMELAARLMLLNEKRGNALIWALARNYFKYKMIVDQAFHPENEGR